jgi:hypothetical protein
LTLTDCTADFLRTDDPCPADVAGSNTSGPRRRMNVDEGLDPTHLHTQEGKTMNDHANDLTTPLPCPPWCVLPAGHEFHSLTHEGLLFRSHEGVDRSMGNVGISLISDETAFAPPQEERQNVTTVDFFESTKRDPPLPLRRTESVDGLTDEAFRDGAWQPTKVIGDYMFGNNDFVSPITEERARLLEPDALVD